MSKSDNIRETWNNLHLDLDTYEKATPTIPHQTHLSLDYNSII